MIPKRLAFIDKLYFRILTDICDCSHCNFDDKSMCKRFAKCYMNMCFICSFTLRLNRKRIEIHLHNGQVLVLVCTLYKTKEKKREIFLLNIQSFV